MGQAFQNAYLASPHINFVKMVSLQLQGNASHPAKIIASLRHEVHIWIPQIIFAIVYIYQNLNIFIACHALCISCDGPLNSDCSQCNMLRAYEEFPANHTCICDEEKYYILVLDSCIRILLI